ncbi:MAG: hypothetical protein NZ518_12060, partial [Dehalococcoidia bacterium]|nr:hypothetical protein [Dehalococcoidia bacterium]
AVATGMLIEGLTVGVAQWAALRCVFPTVSLGRWAVATAIGAGIAWALGMAPSALMALSESSTEAAAAPEISEAMVYVLAAGMGVALGPILGIAQWIVLRQVAWNASIWIPAQSVAWAIGMLVVFFGVSLIGERGVSVVSVTGALAALAVAGAAVGATHGVALLWLAQRPRIAPKPSFPAAGDSAVW